MTYSISTHDSVQVLAITNLLNELDNKAILSEVQKHIEQGFNKLVVDLSQLNFMNSVGLNFMIMMLSKSQNSGGKMAVVNAPDQVLDLLEMTKLREHFQLESSLDMAIRDFTVN